MGQGNWEGRQDGLTGQFSELLTSGGKEKDPGPFYYFNQKKQVAPGLPMTTAALSPKVPLGETTIYIIGLQTFYFLNSLFLLAERKPFI